MHNRSAFWLRTISVLLFSLLAGCYSDVGFVKNGVIPIGNKLYLVVDSSVNELVITTALRGAQMPSEKYWKGKPCSENEIIRYDILTKEITSLSKMEKPAPGTLVIIFQPKHIKVYEGDGEKSVHKHRRPTPNRE